MAWPLKNIFFAASLGRLDRLFGGGGPGGVVLHLAFKKRQLKLTSSQAKQRFSLNQSIKKIFKNFSWGVGC